MQILNIIIFCLFLPSTIHDFHVSKCLVKYDQEEKAIQISMHIFLDDLEAALALDGHTGLKLCTEKEKPGADQLIVDYLNRQFQVRQDGQLLSPVFIGKEISEDLAAVWCYLEITSVNATGVLELKNEVLMDLFDDQRNIVSVTIPSGREYFLFQKGDSSSKLTF